MVSTAPLLDGDPGTLQTLQALSSFVSQYSGSPAVRSAVVEALRGAPRGTEADLRGLLSWVRDHTRFTRDPLDTELVHSPVVILEIIRRDGVFLGDCDDLSGLLATLAEGAGYETRFHVQGPDGGDYSHVLVDVLTPTGWVSLDPSNPTADPGWAPSVGVGREATMGMGSTLRGRLGDNGDGSGTDYLAFGPEEYGVPIDGTVDYSSAVVSEVVPQTVGVIASSTDWWDSFTSGLRSLATTVLPIAERYGVTPAPVVGYRTDGTPIYSASVLPVGGSQGALWSSLSQPVIGGLSLGTLLIVGGAAFLLLGTGRRRK
jgi:hypothetical protein